MDDVERASLSMLELHSLQKLVSFCIVMFCFILGFFVVVVVFVVFSCASEELLKLMGGGRGTHKASSPLP